ncbi:hypothetical protein Ancab_021771 [Ancistrocladus abbreviatus]
MGFRNLGGLLFGSLFFGDIVGCSVLEVCPVGGFSGAQFGLHCALQLQRTFLCMGKSSVAVGMVPRRLYARCSLVLIPAFLRVGSPLKGLRARGFSCTQIRSLCWLASLHFTASKDFPVLGDVLRCCGWCLVGLLVRWEAAGGGGVSLSCCGRGCGGMGFRNLGGLLFGSLFFGDIVGCSVLEVCPVGGFSGAQFGLHCALQLQRTFLCMGKSSVAVGVCNGSGAGHLIGVCNGSAAGHLIAWAYSA